jgi:large subunit ribosomal protein L21
MIKRLGTLAAAIMAAIAAAGAALGIRRRSKAIRRRERQEARRARTPASANRATPAATPPTPKASSADADVRAEATPPHREGATTRGEAADESGVTPAAAATSLRAIRGLGAAAEERLAGLGITTVDEVAAWTDEDVERISGEIRISADRIRREDWVGQANALRSGE